MITAIKKYGPKWSRHQCRRPGRIPRKLQFHSVSASAAIRSGLPDDDDQAVHYFADLRLGNATGMVEDNPRVGRE